MDDIDRDILRLLRADGRMAKAEIAKRVGLSPPAVNDRIRRLETSGVILRYTVEVSPQAAELPEVSFVLIRGRPAMTATQIEELFAFLAAMEEVRECHHIAGEEDIVVKLRSRSRDHLSDTLRRIRLNNGVASSTTLIVLTTYKEALGVDV